ncbi:hypothetical protein [uncultured Deinococcus sp.]|uniref:hypothetical protein n=1 Tax=uncultured Deinococcus sp. TaxID=158789 RepID=UPI00258CE219|nr:hypothetical protein [uncultured Deinococcus sp.]
MRLKYWRFRVRDALGNFRHLVEMSASNVDGSGLRFEVMPHDVGRCTFQARPDGPRLAWGDVLEIEAAELSTDEYTRLYRGEARTVGLSGSPELVQYELVSLRQRLSETEMPELTLESMDAGAQLRAVLEVMTAGQVWGNAIYYDPQYVPDVGVNAPRLDSTAFQLLAAYLDELAGLVNGSRPDQAPVVWGVNVAGYLTWGVSGGVALDVRGRSDVAATEWGAVVCENPCTAVRWFLRPFADLGAVTALSRHPAAATLGRRMVRQSLNVLEVWESVTSLPNPPAGSGYSWGTVSAEDRVRLQRGTAAVPVTFNPTTGAREGAFDITPDDPWSYAHFTGVVTPPRAKVQLSIVPYDSGRSINIQVPVSVAGEFDVRIAARTDLSLGGTGVRSNLTFEVPEDVAGLVTCTFRRAGYFAPDQDRLDALASAFYQLPDALVGRVELRSLTWPPPRQVTVVGPGGTAQTAAVTTEYEISAGAYGHTHLKIGSPDPPTQRAMRQLQLLRAQDAAATALTGLVRR